MISPTLGEFLELAHSWSVVTVHERLLADHVTPVSVFQRLCGDGPGFLLESVDHGGRWSRWSFVGVRSLARLVSRNGALQLQFNDDAEDLVRGEIDSVGAQHCGGVLDAIELLTERFKCAPFDSAPPLHAGVVGYLGYDVVREVEHLPDVPTDDAGWPDAELEILGELVALDHWSQQAILMSNIVIPGGASEEELAELYRHACERIAAMATAGAEPIDEPLVSPPTQRGDLASWQSSMSDEYCDAVEIAKEHIRAGDIFQVVLSQRFSLRTTADPFDIYRVLRQINPSPYMYFVRHNEVTLVGCSPEPMVQLLDGTVISRPIAGTRFRGSTDEHDRKLGAELMEHPKERAEHVMLVDLARNDVGKVVDFGTCGVDEMMVLERYSHVMHLTSQVSGRLRDGLGPVDVLRATLPAGTVSGAPKVRAMQLIDELERTKRGPYAGLVGYVDFSGNVDTAIAIRTMLIETHADATGHRRASVQAGAGIVADSDPSDEELETQNKAKALLVAIEPAELMTQQRGANAAH